MVSQSQVWLGRLSLPPGVSNLAQTSVTGSANVEVCFQPNRRGAGKSLAALQDRAMVKRTAPIRVVSLILLAACGALGQKSPSADLLQGLQFEGSNSPEVQRPEMGTWRSLPDAPSLIQPPRRAERFPTFVFPTFVFPTFVKENETGSPLTLGAVGVSAGVIRGTKLGHVTPGSQPRLTALYQHEPALSPFDQQQLYGPGHVRSFAHFCHA